MKTMKGKILMLVAIWLVSTAPPITSWMTAVDRMFCLIAAYVILTMKEWEDGAGGGNNSAK